MICDLDHRLRKAVPMSLPADCVQRRKRSDAGYTLIEIMAVCALVGIIAAIAVPSTTTTMAGYRLKGDAEGINNLTSLAKMRAASQYSRARVYADLNAGTYQLQTWDKTNSVWTTEGGVKTLATGVSFGVGAITVAPPNTQAAIGQSPACTDNAGADIGNTACITFNSRGMPVANSLPPAGGVTGNSALYITDGITVYGTTITTTPLIKMWWSPNSNNKWVRQ
jgi:prepilin-type N-terminal cleavage/methylation domain-containing protein